MVEATKEPSKICLPQLVRHTNTVKLQQKNNNTQYKDASEGKAGIYLEVPDCVQGVEKVMVGEKRTAMLTTKNAEDAMIYTILKSVASQKHTHDKTEIPVHIK